MTILHCGNIHCDIHGNYKSKCVAICTYNNTCTYLLSKPFFGLVSVLVCWPRLYNCSQRYIICCRASLHVHNEIHTSLQSPRWLLNTSFVHSQKLCGKPRLVDDSNHSIRPPHTYRDLAVRDIAAQTQAEFGKVSKLYQRINEF